MRRQQLYSYFCILCFCSMSNCLVEESNSRGYQSLEYQSQGECTPMLEHFTHLPIPPAPPESDHGVDDDVDDSVDDDGVYEGVEEEENDHEEEPELPQHFFRFVQPQAISNYRNSTIKMYCRGVFLNQTSPIHNCLDCRKLIYRDSHISTIQTNLNPNSADLQELDLAETSIQKIETGAFAHLPSLTVLNLAANKLKTVSRGTFNSLLNLQLLNLSHNVISVIEEESFHGSRSIETLDLSHNKIRTLPPGLFLHLTLRSLNISNNLLVEVDEVFCDSAQVMVSLIMSHNLLYRIPDCLNISLIYDLSLSFNSISEFNSSLLPLRLETFAISSNDLGHINEDSFRSLTYLKSIDLSDNSLNVIHAKYFEDQRNLRILKFTGNNIRTIAKMFIYAELLEELQIGRNNISTLPKGTFHHLSNLKRLDISENSIDYIQLNVLNDLVSLELLNISHNKIEYLQSGVFNGMKMMKHLDLSFNNIESLQYHIFLPLSSLSILDIQSNQIKTLDFDLLHPFSRQLSLISLDGNNISCISLGKFISRVKFSQMRLERGKTISSENINGISCHEFVAEEIETSNDEGLSSIKSFFENDFKKTSFFNFFKNFSGGNSKDDTKQNLSSVIEFLSNNFSTDFTKELNLHVKEFMEFENTSFQNFLKELSDIAGRLQDSERDNTNLSLDDLSLSLRNEIKKFVNFENSSLVNFLSTLSGIIDKMVDNHNKSNEIPEMINDLYKIRAEKFVSSEESKGTMELISAVNQLKVFLVLCTFIVLLLFIAIKIFPHVEKKYFKAKPAEQDQEMPILP